MTQSASRRRTWPAMLLGAVLVLGSGLGAITLGAEQPAEPAPSPSAGAGAAAEPAPRPAPTPYPAFDPARVSVRTTLFAEGLSEPVYLADDGVENSRCLYVVERAGRIVILRPDGTPIGKPFLDIRGRVLSDHPERGLHSVAFHPDFAKNGRYFVHFNDKNGAAVIAEFRGRPCKPVAKNGNKPVRTLFTVGKDFPNNNAGWIGFGPDGRLYIPLGDGGGGWPGDPNGIGQTASTRLSKVLRVDVGRNDLIAVDNPFVKKAKDGKLKSRRGFPRETWAWGLRDPRRSSFDRQTGDFWIGDVGQELHEEVNLIRAGSVTKNEAPNFGWSHVEGESSCHPANAPDCDPAAYTPPVYSYDKVPPHRAITGGYVYRGESIPPLKGVYLFSDFSSGFIWGLDADAIYEGFEVPAHQLLDAPQGFVSFGEDDAGELYLVTLDGSIYQLSVERR